MLTNYKNPPIQESLNFLEQIMSLLPCSPYFPQLQNNGKEAAGITF